ncbi:MAG TPA: molybdenum cofactor biosynthesis protein [Planctomycetaceae bacterium]|nr:molybdenum cofactor biosynthesis protein [Planctomycetaceae bacterium]
MNSPSAQEHRDQSPQAIQFGVITVSDTRTLESDKSGQLIADSLCDAGHKLKTRIIVPDEPDQIVAQVQEHVAQETEAVILTGGTGIARRDHTCDAIEPLLEMHIPGFGELFRYLSYEDIGSAAMLSRAMAGRIGSTLVFCLPGSSAAVRLALEKLLVPELPHLVFHSRR